MISFLKVSFSMYNLPNVTNKTISTVIPNNPNPTPKFETKNGAEGTKNMRHIMKIMNKIVEHEIVQPIFCLIW